MFLDVVKNLLHIEVLHFEKPSFLFSPNEPAYLGLIVLKDFFSAP
jgi:hypothetical protein